KRKGLFAEFALKLRGLFGVYRLLRLFDKRKHIAHAEYPRRHPVGMEGLDIVQLFAHAYEFYRLARDVPHRKRGAAPRVAVELCEDDARYVKQVVEALCDVDGILTGHRIDRKQYLRRLYRVLYALQLGHELLVH